MSKVYLIIAGISTKTQDNVPTGSAPIRGTGRNNAGQNGKKEDNQAGTDRKHDNDVRTEIQELSDKKESRFTVGRAEIRRMRDNAVTEGFHIGKCPRTVCVYGLEKKFKKAAYTY